MTGGSRERRGTQQRFSGSERGGHDIKCDVVATRGATVRRTLPRLVELCACQPFASCLNRDLDASRIDPQRESQPSLRFRNGKRSFVVT